jgi:hypothetical protein
MTVTNLGIRQLCLGSGFFRGEELQRRLLVYGISRSSFMLVYRSPVHSQAHMTTEWNPAW